MQVVLVLGFEKIPIEITANISGTEGGHNQAAWQSKCLELQQYHAMRCKKVETPKV